MASILVEILGNAKQFKSELDGAVASTEKANSGFGKMQKVAGVAGLAIAGGLGVALDKSMKAAEEAQVTTSRMNAAFAASHVSAKAFAGGIEEAETKSRQLGFTNDSVKNSLGSLVIATHDGNKAITDLGVAEDIARFKHISLEAASKTLTMAMAGSTRATKQLGIDVPKVTTAQDALKASGSQLKSEIVQQEGVVLKLRDAHDKSTAGVKALKDAQATLSIEQQHAREVTLSHTSATYLAEVAHAKLQDRLSTENAVIATVSEKLHGQADAYSKTAEGGMAQFHAQINNLEEGLGKALLPVITSVSQKVASLAKFFSDHTTTTKVLTVALGALAGILLTISAATKIQAAYTTIATAATKLFTVAQEEEDAALVANPIGIVVVALVALAAALVVAWQHSSTFRAIVTGAFDDVKIAAQTVAGFFTKTLPAAFNAVIGWVRSNWPVIAVLISGPFAPIVALATNAFGIRSALVGAFNGIKNAITGILGGLVDTVTGLATNIGGAIIDGIKNGMGDITHIIGNFLGSGLHSAVGFAKGMLGIGSPSRVTHEQLGKPMAEGVIEGWLLGSASLPSKMSQSLQNAVQAGQRVIQAAATTFQTGWSKLAQDADAAFTKIHATVQTKSEKVIAAIKAAAAAAQLTGALSTAQAGLASAQAGPQASDAEKALAALQAAHDEAGRQQSLADAQSKLADAQGGGDPAAIAQAQQAVADAQYTIQVAALNKQIAAEQAAASQKTAITQAQQAVDDANQAIVDAATQARLDKQAANERAQLDARDALQQQHFDTALANLETHLAKAHTSYKQAHAAILKLFKSYGVNYNAAGADLATAFITGLKESIQGAAKGAGALSGTLTDVAAGIHVPHAATGGVVSQTGLAVIHQGETITPASSGGSISITVNGWVGSDQAIAEKLRNELIRLGRNTTGGVLGGFA